MGAACKLFGIRRKKTTDLESCECMRTVCPKLPWALRPLWIQWYIPALLQYFLLQQAWRLPSGQAPDLIPDNPTDCRRSQSPSRHVVRPSLGLAEDLLLWSSVSERYDAQPLNPATVAVHWSSWSKDMLPLSLLPFWPFAFRVRNPVASRLEMMRSLILSITLAHW